MVVWVCVLCVCVCVYCMSVCLHVCAALEGVLGVGFIAVVVVSVVDAGDFLC